MNENLQSKVYKMSDKSPLIKWLIKTLPLLLKSFALAIIISYGANKIIKTDNSVLKISGPIFLALTLITHYAPGVLNNVEYGIGFAVALYLLK